jgi:hypothetical protein
MVFLVRVRVNLETMQEFGLQLMKNELDRSCIRGETHCLKDDPAVGYSIWEAPSREAFDATFGPWRKYYTDVEVSEVITPMAAMMALQQKTR